MRKVLKVIGVVSVVLVLFFVVASVAFYHLVRIGEFRRFLAAEIEKNTDLKVQLGEAGLEIGWVTGVVFRQVALSEPGAVQPAITAESITARVALQPLLQRKIIFYEIRLQRPTARFVTDREGRIALLDKLLNLPILRQQNRDFELDLRAVRVQGGAIELVDQRPTAVVKRWRLVDGTVNLERVRGQRLRAFIKELLQRGPAQSPREALEFSFRGTVENDSGKMNIKAQGQLLFPKEALEFHQARWIADVELVDIPAALVQQYAARRVPLKSMTGYFAQRFHLDGNPAQQLHLRGSLEFRQLAINAPNLLIEPITPIDGQTSFDLEWSRQRLLLNRAEFRSAEIKFALQGEVRALDTDDPYFNLTVSGLSTPAQALRKYAPVKIADAPRLMQSLEAIEAGQLEISRGGINGSLADLRQIERSGPGKRLWFEAAVREGAGKLPVTHSLPLRMVQGQFKLQDGVLTFQDFRGSYGDSRLADVDGSYDLMPGGAGQCEFHARGDFNLAEIKEQLNSGVFSAQAAKLAASVHEITGRSRADMTIKSVPDGAFRVDGRATLDNIRLRYESYALSEVRGELYFSPKE
ncbi:MAG TPA: AsmA family protein, partial [Terriglobales bacterium]|nr:AsmA family protein [Terriglobales bacterium]